MTRLTTGELIASDGTSLSWQAWLPARRAVAAVAMLHGAGEHGGRYASLVRPLVDRGHAVYALDMRGHGRSGGPRGSVGQFGDYVSDAALFVELVAGEQERAGVYALGYSLGGLVALTYACKHQERLDGVIVAAPALGPGREASRLELRASRLLAAVAPRLPLLRLDPASMMQDATAIRSYSEDPLVHRGRFDAQLIAEFVGAIRAVGELIGRLQVPLLVLHGADDVTASPDASRALVRRAGSDDKTLHVYERTRHDLFNEPLRDRISADVITWLEARSKGRSTQMDAQQATTAVSSV